ncbi:MAG: hypothetical protein KJ674_01450 [Nanoarchaeota archaeon]|nr:hypothetical protein [Nanoarchaeota archaeon]
MKKRGGVIRTIYHLRSLISLIFGEIKSSIQISKEWKKGSEERYSDACRDLFKNKIIQKVGKGVKRKKQLVNKDSLQIVTKDQELNNYKLSYPNFIDFYLSHFTNFKLNEKERKIMINYFKSDFFKKKLFETLINIRYVFKERCGKFITEPLGYVDFLEDSDKKPKDVEPFYKLVKMKKPKLKKRFVPELTKRY